MDAWAENDYLLLTPGPLSTSPTVRAAMDRDWCTWDDDYNVGIVSPIRERLVDLATATQRDQYSSVLMQGSGTFGVEAMIGTLVPRDGKLLVLANGAYGNRLAKIAAYLKIDHLVHDTGELAPPNIEKLDLTLAEDPAITHVVVVHNETTTGMLNPVEPICQVVKRHGRIMLLDSMSAFGGVPFDVATLGVDCVVSSSNKCVQGVPGFSFVICRRDLLEQSEGQARSLSMDLFDQWKTMEHNHGKWRFTSPTHVVRAFYQALQELEEEGGVEARYARYCQNQKTLVEGMESLGFRSLLPHKLHSPIITGFLDPESSEYNFDKFYGLLKSKGFVIYPGKVTNVNSFRIGTIGHVFPSDIERLIGEVKSSMYWAS